MAGAKAKASPAEGYRPFGPGKEGAKVPCLMSEAGPYTPQAKGMWRAQESRVM